jgi:hypothetical protein
MTTSKSRSTRRRYSVAPVLTVLVALALLDTRLVDLRVG